MSDQDTKKDGESRQEHNEYDTPLWKRFIEMEFAFTDGITSDEKYAKETNFVLERANLKDFLKPGDRVLDICSGDSEHARRLSAATGAHVEARDFSEQLVEEGRRTTKAEIAAVVNSTISVNSEFGDMGNIKASIKPGERFKAVTIFGSSFLYLGTHEAHVKALKDYNDVLENGGKVVIQWYENDKERAKVWMQNLPQHLKDNNLAMKWYNRGETIQDPMDPDRFLTSELTDLERGDSLYIAGSHSHPDSQFMPYPDLGISIGQNSFARVYKHPNGSYEPQRALTHTTNYMLKEKFPVLKRMLEDAGFVNVKLVPSEGEQEEFFSEKGRRKLYAVVAEKPV